MSKQKNVKLKPITHHLIYTEMNKRMKSLLSEIEIGENLQDIFEKITQTSAYSEIIKRITREVRIKELIS